MRKRIYEQVIEEHFLENRQMLFLVGPRQVGKTTTSIEIASPHKKHFYFNWDNQDDQKLILDGPKAIADAVQLEYLSSGVCFIIFDELHKYSKWKNFLKGFFDTYSDAVQILVTGSARLDVYKAGGDSLMGRYFPYRLHPFSIGEVASCKLPNSDILRPPHPIHKDDFDALLTFGGFPEPFIKRNTAFYNRWKKLRYQLLFEEDLRDLTRIQELGQLRLLAELIKDQAGQQTNYSALANKVRVSIDTIRRWVETLKSFYYCFSIQPWSKNITRSLLKEPKLYLWDWSLIEDEGARHENFIASHLLKATHFWTDRGLGDFGLYYLRDKEKREVDFLITKNETPWILAEAKTSGNDGLSPSLYHYQSLTQAPYAFQVALDLPYINKDCFEVQDRPIIVPARTFLSQLV